MRKHRPENANETVANATANAAAHEPKLERNRTAGGEAGPSLSTSTPDLPARASSDLAKAPPNVVPFPRAPERPLPDPAELGSVLLALARTSRASLYYLRLLTGLTGRVVDECVRRLEASGLVTSEHRTDGNEPRRMVEITAAGRRALGDGDRPA